jgi:hypothetical protein
LDHPAGYERQLWSILQKFEPSVACKAIDERLEMLAGKHTR